MGLLTKLFLILFSFFSIKGVSDNIPERIQSQEVLNEQVKCRTLFEFPVAVSLDDLIEDLSERGTINDNQISIIVSLDDVEAQFNRVRQSFTTGFENWKERNCENNNEARF